MTITQRDKNTVKGKYGAKNRKTGEVYPGFDFEGEIDGVRLIAKSTGNAKKRSMTLSLKGDELEGTLVLLDTKGTAKLAFTLEK